jgi:release factor glutamine methyltransferase
LPTNDQPGPPRTSLPSNDIGDRDPVAVIVARLRAAGCVYAEDEARLLVEHTTDADRLDSLVEQRVAGRPLEQLLGWVDFAGLRLIIEPGVFVPRQRSELLVRRAVTHLDGHHGVATVVDLCCGSGAIGVAIAAQRHVDLHAADIDPAALACARRNLVDRGQVHQGDLYDALPRDLQGRVDVLVVNAPYVPAGDLDLMPAEARLYEPRRALVGGSDGLDIQRRVMANATDWLAAGGLLLVETSTAQADRSRSLAESAGMAAQVVHCNELDATAVLAHR